jgi:hypothetical protein
MARSVGLAEIADMPWNNPDVDADEVALVLSGDSDDIRERLRSLAVPPEAAETTDRRGKCPTGTRPCPQGCRSIQVWGKSLKLSEESRVEMLLNLCRDFGEVTGLEVQDALGRAHAVVMFKESSAAEAALICLHKEVIDGKVRLKNVVG